jgi:hypothetical protein
MGTTFFLVTDDAQGNPPAVNLDSAASSLQADAANLDFLLHSLADKLAAVPGLELKIKYRQSWLSRLVGDLPYVNDLHSKSGPIERLQVRIGPSTFWLDASRSSISCGTESSSATSGQVGHPQSFSEWIKGVIATIDQQSKVTQESLQALQDLIVSDRTE